MERWEGKVAVVTGASSGIGAAVAKALVIKGLKVIGLARRVERIEELALTLTDQPGELFAVSCDITNEDNIIESFQWILDNVGPIHILINNAGLTKPTSLTDGVTDDWRHVFEVNVMALCVCTREAVKIMRANEIEGHVIHLNSVAGHRVPPLASFSVYPASKFAVTALTQSLRVELARDKCNIKVTSISPGVVRTEFQDGFPDDGTREALATMPGLQPEAVAEAIVYALATPPGVQVNELMIGSVGELF